MIELVIITIFVVGVSHLCSLMEAILYSLPEGYIESLEHKGRSAGRILKKLRENVDEPIAAILTLNTIANTAGATMAGVTAAEVMGSRWVGFYSGALTLAILLLSEVIPKTAGVLYSRALGPIIARPLQAVVFLLKPAVWLCGLTTKLITRSSEISPLSLEEILAMARIGVNTGMIKNLEGDLIRNIVTLRFRKVKEVMTPRTVVTSFESTTTVKKVLRQESFFTHSRIPVYFKEMEDIGGMVLRSDVLHAAAQKETERTLEALMRPIHFIPETITLDRALFSFLERKEQLFIVLDEYGGVAGLITLEDVLEEILGKEIVDEFDQVEDMRQLAQQRRAKTMVFSEE